MPNTKSAKKRVITNEKHKIRNKAKKSAIRTAEKKFKAFVKASDAEAAKKQLQVVFKKLDKAAKVGTIHRNKANRKKSRLSSLLCSIAK